MKDIKQISADIFEILGEGYGFNGTENEAIKLLNDKLTEFYSNERHGSLQSMRTYTSQEIMKLVRDEIDHSNRIIGRKTLSSTDYIVIGMVSEALRRDEINSEKKYECEKCGCLCEKGQGHETGTGFVCVLCI